MIDLTRAVLLPVDMQRGFDEPSWPRRWNTDADRNGQTVLGAWRASGRSVIHVRHDSIETGSTLRPGLPGNGFRPGFEPDEGEPIVSKSVNSAFIGTDLDLRLKRLDAGAVVVFGMTTDMCVSTTIRTGANLGWRMILVANACDCFDLPGESGALVPAETVQAVHVATLAYEFCTIVSTADLLGSLDEARTHPSRDHERSALVEFDQRTQR